MLAIARKRSLSDPSTAPREREGDNSSRTTFIGASLLIVGCCSVYFTMWGGLHSVTSSRTLRAARTCEHCGQSLLPYFDATYMALGADLHFLVSAFDDLYEDWLLPYSHFVLTSNPNATVEILVSDPQRFADSRAELLEVFWRSQPGRIHIRQASEEAVALAKRAVPSQMWKNSVRFFERPSVSGRITYIGDVDIVMLDCDVASAHATHMHDPQWNLPYSNMVRNYSKPEAEWRFTGLHAVDTAQYYGPHFDAALKVVHNLSPFKSDEHALAALCRAGYGLPQPPPELMGPNHVRANMPPVFLYRPVHGIHLSPNRGVGKPMELTATCEECAQYRTIHASAPVLAALLVVSKAMRDIHQSVMDLCSCCTNAEYSSVKLQRKKRCRVGGPGTAAAAGHAGNE